MRSSLSRRYLISAGLCALLLTLAAPAVATTAHQAVPGGPARTSALRPAIPDPEAPHSAAIVPGVTGAAARKADPPISASRRFTELNAASHRAAARARAGEMSGAPSPSPDMSSWTGTFHGYWGTFPSQTIYGAQATQSLNPNVAFSSTDSDYIYSPTLDPSGIGCIEISTIYDGGGDYVGAWDWCAATPGFAKTVAVDSDFLATYSETVNGQSYYTVQDVQTDPTANSWTAYLYNYTTGEWDTFYTSASTSPLGSSGGGWDMNEVYSNYDATTGEGGYCTDTAGALWESTGLMYQLSSGTSTWTPANAANSSMNLAYPTGGNMGCNTTGYALPTANSDWQVTNATHNADGIVGAGSGKCVNIPGSDFANGARAQIYTCNGTGAQSLTYDSSGELTLDGGQYCLDARGYGTTDGTPIQVWTCHGTTNEQWSFSLNGSIIGIGSGLCLNVTAYGTTNGSPLQLWACLGTSNDQWSWAGASASLRR
jgi:Ricin-type beta-trefoil lectin domain